MLPATVMQPMVQFSWMLLGAIAWFPLQTPIAFALSAPEVGKIARNITVRIDSDSPGSGVMVKQDGESYTVLTAAHVVPQVDGTYEVVTPDRARYPVLSRSIQRIGNVDLAVLQFKSSQPYTVATLGDANQSLEGTPCYVAGFPGKTVALTEVIFNFTTGQITANANRPLRDGYALVYSNATLPGMSGGAVLNDRGQLIGIHGRSDTTTEAQNPTLNPNIYIKTGFNLGIPINTFLNLAPQVKLSLGLTLPPPKAPAATPTASDLLLSGGDQLQRGDNRSAASNFTTAIRSNGRNADAYSGRGLSRYQQGDYESALADFNQAVSINPYNARFYNNRGLVLLGLAEQSTGTSSYLDRADADFTEAIRLDPTAAEVYNNRGLVRMGLGARELAIADYTEAIRLDPGLVKAYKNRGSARSAIQDKQGAIDDFNQSIRIDARYAAAYQALGFVRFELGDKSGAIAAYNQALTLNPKSIDALTERGLIRYELSEIAGAMKDWESATANRKREAAGAYLFLAAALYAQGKTDAALKLGTTAIQLDRTWTNEGLLQQILGEKLLKATQTLLAQPSMQALLRSP
ncbi:MAG TPA: tetratricopeptide repeat protein [Stenomitos sp.]